MKQESETACVQTGCQNLTQEGAEFCGDRCASLCHATRCREPTSEEFDGRYCSQACYEHAEMGPDPYSRDIDYEREKANERDLSEPGW